MKTHIEHYRAGYVVCLGEHYGEALSRAFKTLKEAQEYQKAAEGHLAAIEAAQKELGHQKIFFKNKENT